MTDTQDIDRHTSDRVIRVFISSTFRDMAAERELLVKKVFPELRRICAGRFVTFTEVDLRWGINEEQAAEGKVLPICLEEIQRCRPFFIGLLGERYGWVPEEFPSEVMADEPWLREHVDKKTSVTELEILHGVLNNPQIADRAFFYFRDPAYLAAIPEEDKDEFLSHDPESRRKLEELKDRIRQSGLPVLENYAGPEALAAAVRGHLMALIDQLYPKEDVPDPLDQEAMRHEAFAKGKLVSVIQRPDHIKAIDDFVEKDSIGQGLIITGDSGGGKTVLLASWVQHRIKKSPDDFVFQHYFGSTPESSTAAGFLHRLLAELKRRFQLPDEIPAEFNQMRDALPLWLGQIAKEGKIILVLDALNQVEGDEPDRRLDFLPRYFPPHVKVVGSSLPGPALETLKMRGWSKHFLPLPDLSERTRMIESFLGRYRKSLGSDLLEELAGSSGSANPLFLHTVLEELRQFGKYEELPERVSHYLEARSPEDLFCLVIRRWQEDFDGGRDLVRHTLSYLWGARQGLSETEWLELLGTDHEAFNRQEWTPLLLAIEVHLAQRSGLYTFGHDFLRKAVEREYLHTEKDRQSVHLKLADYFQGSTDSVKRRSAEWPWQLNAAGQWEGLLACLTDEDLFLSLNNESGIWELIGYWHPLRKQGADLGKCYRQALQKWLEPDPRHLTGKNRRLEAHLEQEVGSFLITSGCFEDAESLLQKAVWHNMDVFGEDHPETLRSKDNLGICLKSLGKLYEAESLFHEVFLDRLRILGKDHPDSLSALNNYAAVLLEDKDLDNAASTLEYARKSSEHNLGKDHPVTLAIMRNQGLCQELMGDYDKAETYYRTSLENKERNLGRDHPSTLQSMDALATLLHQKGENLQAQSHYRGALEGRERILGIKHPETIDSMYNLALFYADLGSYSEAQDLFVRLFENDPSFFKQRIDGIVLFSQHMKEAGIRLKPEFDEVLESLT